MELALHLIIVKKPLAYTETSCRKRKQSQSYESVFIRNIREIGVLFFSQSGFDKIVKPEDAD